MSNHPVQSDAETRQELEKERDLRKKYEAQASAARLELAEIEATLEKYKRLPARVDKYRHRSRKLKGQRNFFGIVSILLLLTVSYFLVDQYQKARELEHLKNEVKAAGTPKQPLPGIITQEAMEKDAERQGGSLVNEE